MAVKDHSLDDKIRNAAMEEFIKHGYLAASLHKIADRAGVTTGALYTRYKNKDDLFGSLLEEIFDLLQSRGEAAAKQYEKAEKSGSVSDFLAAMRFEEQIYMDIFFEYYDECLLFFCKSNGSSVEDSLNKIIDYKVDTTVSFLKKAAGRPVNREAVYLLLDANFHMYRQLLLRGQEKAEAAACMKVVQDFWETGWKNLYEQL